MQFHFVRRHNTDPAPITRKTSESSENTLPNKDNAFEREEDIVLNTTPFLQIQVCQITMTVMITKMNILLNSYFLQSV